MNKAEATKQATALRKELNKNFGKGWKIEMREDFDYCEGRCRKGVISVEQLEVTDSMTGYLISIHPDKTSMDVKWELGSDTLHDAFNLIHSRVATEVYTAMQIFDELAEPILRKAITTAAMNGKEFADIEETA